MAGMGGLPAAYSIPLAGAGMKQDGLLAIQLARGVAALLVIFYHAGRMIAPAMKWDLYQTGAAGIAIIVDARMASSSGFQPT
jgi:hypothetical protein